MQLCALHSKHSLKNNIQEGQNGPVSVTGLPKK